VKLDLDNIDPKHADEIAKLAPETRDFIVELLVEVDKGVKELEDQIASLSKANAELAHKVVDQLAPQERTAKLDEIQSRFDASTQGTWTDGAAGYVYLGSDHVRDPLISVDTEVGKQADAEFVAHAHQDIPFLLAEVARLRGIIHAEMLADAKYCETCERAYTSEGECPLLPFGEAPASTDRWHAGAEDVYVPQDELFPGSARPTRQEPGAPRARANGGSGVHEAGQGAGQIS